MGVDESKVPVGWQNELRLTLHFGRDNERIAVAALLVFGAFIWWFTAYSSPYFAEKIWGIYHYITKYNW